MSPEIIAIIALGVTLIGVNVGLFAWLHIDLQALGKRLVSRIDNLAERLDSRIDKLADRLDKFSDRLDRLADRVTAVEKELAGMKATVETYFRVRVDRPPPPDPDPRDCAA